AAQDSPVQHARQGDVVDERPLAPDESSVLFAGDRSVGCVKYNACCFFLVFAHDWSSPASCLAAQRTERTMFSYPVHRQIWPERASRMASSLGSGLRFSSQRAVSIMPGVQKPHCRPWHWANAFWTGSRVPPMVARPSTVKTRRPSAIAASTVQDLTGVSSSQTTQAPQLEVSQPQCDPVRPSSSRM